MTSASDPRVTNELLSAYIDEAVSEEERRLIESAVAQDPEVAWRLESLRATVRLLHELPEVALPRSFLLTPNQVAQPTLPVAVTAAAISAAKTQAAGVQATNDEGGFWQAVWRGWHQLWQGGSPALRNAMAASFAVLLALLLAPRFLAPPSLPISQVQTTAAVQQEATAIVEAYEEPAEGEAAPAQIAQMEVAREAAAEAEQPADPGSAVTEDAAAKEPAQTAPETTNEAAVAANAMPPMEADSVIAEDSEGAISMAAEAEAPAAAAVVAPSVLPAAAAPASAREMAQDPTLAQPTSGSSILDEMQRQAGGAPGAATGAGGQDGVTIASSAPSALAQEAAVQEAAAEAAAADVAATDNEFSSAELAYEAAPMSPLMETATAIPTAEPTVAPTAAIAMAPAEVQASEQVEAIEPAAAPVSAVGATAWQLLALQGGALLAGVATLIFGLLWWRSRG